MYAFLITSLGLTSLVASLPSPQADVVRVLPRNWEFDIVGTDGPGCSAASTTNAGTRLSGGGNTMDGSEIYYWEIAYPDVRAKVDSTTLSTHTWCTTTLKYTEYDSYDASVPTANYQFRLHKNGSSVQAVYDLGEGVRGQWKLTYIFNDSSDIVDTIEFAGPYKTTSSSAGHLYSDSSITGGPHDASTCGQSSTTFKIRADLQLSTDQDGTAGLVESDSFQDKGAVIYYGARQSFTYDWKKCN